MLPLSTPDGASTAVRGTVARATLLARGIETTYRRLGRGPTVVFLAEDAGAGAGALAAALAQRFRVLAPERPAAIALAAPDDVAAWLRDLLDGLGVESASLVAEGELAPAALAFARSDALRVRRLALLVADPADPADPAAGAGPTVAVFAAGAAIDDLLGFLHEDATGTA